jgi:hypothetical protein
MIAALFFYPKTLKRRISMKRLLCVILAMIMLLACFPLAASAEGPLDENGDTGGTGPTGNGGLGDYWLGSWYGMRITVIDITDPSREIDGEQWGKVAAGTVSVDITNLSSSDGFFTRTLAGDSATALTYGSSVVHCGKVSKMEYRDGAALAITNGSYGYKTVTGLPRLLGDGQASAETIKSYINNQAMLTNIASWCGVSSYEELISGKYKLLCEPILYSLAGTYKYAFTATEGAMLKPHGESQWGLINNTLANAFFLEHDELGWDAWTGATNVKQPFQTIIDSLGMHIYSIVPEDVPTPTPTPDPTPTPTPTPTPEPTPPVSVDFKKVEYGTNIGLGGAVFQLTQLSHWESRLVDPNESENSGEEWELVDPDDGEYPQNNAVVVDKSDDVTEWLEIRSTEVVGTFVSESDGAIPVGELEAGSYVIEEIIPPAGYALSDNLNERIQTFDIPREGGYEVGIVFANKKLPGLTVIKVDETTGQPLVGAELSIAHKGGSVVYEGVTTANGSITLDGLDEGWYTVTELAAPNGYLKRGDSKDVFLPNGGSAQIKFDNRKRPTLEIIKQDAQTGQSLSGAKFRVWNTEGKTVGEFTTGSNGKVTIPNLDEAIYSVEEITAPPGYLLDTQHKDVQLEWGKTTSLVFTDAKKPGLTITKYDEQTGEPLADAEFSVVIKGGSVVYEGKTDSNGQIHLTDLTEDWYTITETAAPYGYLIVNAAKDVFLEGGSVVEVRFANRLRPSLRIVKLDEQTKEPLQGAKFKVWATEGDTIGEYVTDLNGEIVIHNLDEIIYSVEEIVAPDGYVLETQHKDVQLEWGKTKTLTYTNLKKPTLTLIKYDELPNEPLAGASFRLWKTEGETVGETMVTDSNGRITWTGLDPGIYSMEEIDEPYGYIPDNQRKEIRLSGGENKFVEFFNRPRPVLTILKRDAITGEPIPETKFLVQRTEGETIGEFLTDDNGRIELSPDTGYLLEESVYKVTEVVPPNEYLLDPVSSKDVQLKWYEPTELVFENTLKPTLIFIKKDGLSGRSISDATYRVDFESPAGGIATVGTYKTKCGLIVLPQVLPGWYSLTEVSPAPGYSLPTNPTTRLHLSPGENAYTYEQTTEDLYVDPRTNPNNGSKGMCGDWCGYLCSTLCAGNCGNAGGGTMSSGNSSNNGGGAFANMTITNGKGETLGSVGGSKDTTAPKLSNGSAVRTGNLTASATFTSSEAGSFYYSAVAVGSAAPNILTLGSGQACIKGENTVSLYLTSGAKDLYIKVKDAAGNVSDALKIEVPAFQTNSGQSGETETSPTPEPEAPAPSPSGGVVWLNPEWSNITIKIGNQ